MTPRAIRPSHRGIFGLLALVLLGALSALTSASPVRGEEIEWIRQFGMIGLVDELAQAVDTDGTVYVAGYTRGSWPGQTSVGDRDAFVRKYDGKGNEVWTRQIGTEVRDWAFGVAVDATGVYVAGFTDGTLPGQTSAGSTDVFVRKYDTNGTELWTRQFGTSSAEEARGTAVDASGVYVVGYTVGTLPSHTGAGGADAFVRKYDVNGNELWTHQFGTAARDLAVGVAANGTGLYVAGYSSGALPGQISAGGTDAFVRKYDVQGKELWTRQFGTPATDLALGIAVDASTVYLAGATSGALPRQISAGGTDAFVRTYDVNGQELWTRQFGTAVYDSVSGISSDASGVSVAWSIAGALPG